MEVDHSDKEYYKTGILGSEGVVMYGNDAVTFVKVGATGRWGITPTRETAFPAPTISQPFKAGTIRNSPATVISENSTTIVIRSSSYPLKLADYSTGSSIFYIDTQSDLIQQARFTYHPSNNETLYMNFVLTERSVDVHRPDDLPFSPRELLWNLLRGPIVDI